jgi:hypothetical protein
MVGQWFVAHRDGRGKGVGGKLLDLSPTNHILQHANDSFHITQRLLLLLSSPSCQMVRPDNASDDAPSEMVCTDPWQAPCETESQVGKAEPNKLDL